VLQAEACNTDTTPTQPHRISNTHRTKNNTTNVVIQQNSRKFLMMDMLISETCWAHKKWNKIASDIKLVFYSSTMVHCSFSRSKICKSRGRGICGSPKKRWNDHFKIAFKVTFSIMELDCCSVRFPKACGWVAVWLHVFLNSAIDRRNWSTSRPSRFPTGGIAPAPIKQ